MYDFGPKDVLAALGILLTLPYIYRFALFVHLYFLRRPIVGTYLHSEAKEPPYALVTGATDGIGKALAAELFARGFSLILHGRNEEKMKTAVAEIRASAFAAEKARNERDVRYFIADAASPTVGFEGIVRQFKDCKITLVIHNVGGSTPGRDRIDAFAEDELLSTIRMNALFPLLLTRALLPQLRLSAKRGPVLVQFVGSQTADISPPRFTLYASSKKFLEALSRGLDMDERVWDAPTGVRFEYVAVGEVRSNAHKAKVWWGCPTSETYAAEAVKRIGAVNSGWRRYAPYFTHAVLQWVVEAMGEKAVEGYVVKEIDAILTRKEKATRVFRQPI